MELWDIYDFNRISTGKTRLRGTPLSDGEYHLTVHICVFAPTGEMLIQKRSPQKKAYPEKWDFTAAGSVLSGETPKNAAERELFEELSLCLSLPDMPPAISVSFKHGFDDFYIFTLSEKTDISSLVLKPDEVCSAAWATEEEVLSLLDKNEFVPYRRALISLLFEKPSGRYSL